MSLSKRRKRSIRSLGYRKGREREGTFLAEGVRVVREALASQAAIDVVIIADSAGEEAISVAKEAEARGIETILLEEGAFREMAATKTPQGIAAVIRRDPARLETVLGAAGDILLLDEVQDPGNVGTLIRCARAFGIAGVIVGKGSADPFQPKAIRAAAGAHFALPIVDRVESVASFLRAREAGLAIVVADARRGTPFDEASYPDRICLVLGNEGWGNRPEVIEEADLAVRIPILDEVDSLNVAVASGILLHALFRRRRALP